MAKRPAPGSPFAGVDAYDTAIVGAIKAVHRTPEGQRAFKYIIEVLAAYYDLSYRANDRDTVFMEGRRFVGAQLVKLINLDMQQLREKHGRPGSSRDPERHDAAPGKPDPGT